MPKINMISENCELGNFVDNDGTIVHLCRLQNETIKENIEDLMHCFFQNYKNNDFNFIQWLRKQLEEPLQSYIVIMAYILHEVGDLKLKETVGWVLFEEDKRNRILWLKKRIYYPRQANELIFSIYKVPELCSFSIQFELIRCSAIEKNYLQKYKCFYENLGFVTEYINSERMIFTYDRMEKGN
ncbi:hypothetical protein GF322_05205 [Candidatus Dependentiae bacterium]|nr:hypothetical protein [Candidatus Dependentiae bacterium]